MSYKILITVNDDIKLNAELNDTPTAKAIYKALPITSDDIDPHGKGIMINTEVVMQYDRTNKVELEIGQLAYWPLARSICVFWGATPASFDNEPRPPAPVSPIGKVLDDITSLDGIEIMKVMIEKIDDVEIDDDELKQEPFKFRV